MIDSGPWKKGSDKILIDEMICIHLQSTYLISKCANIISKLKDKTH